MDRFIPHIEDTFLKRNAETQNWEIIYTIPAALRPDRHARTRAKSTRTPDRSLAQAFQQKWCSGTLVTKNPVHMQVGYILKQYIDLHMAKKSACWSQHWALKPILERLGHLRVDDLVHTPVVQNYIDERINVDGVKPSTARREVGALRSALNWAAGTGQVIPPGSALPKIVLPPPGAPRTEYLTESEEKLVFDRARNSRKINGSLSRPALFICIALRAPARSTAIETLTWDRVDFEKRLIDFRNPKDPSPRNKRRVVMPIANDLYPILKEEYEAALARRGSPLAPGEKLTRPVLGHTGSTQKSVKYWLENMVGITGITRHDLRRTWASLAVQKGVAMADVAAILGDTVAITEKHYGHMDPSGLRQAINKFPTRAKRA